MVLRSGFEYRLDVKARLKKDGSNIKKIINTAKWSKLLIEKNILKQ